MAQVVSQNDISKIVNAIVENTNQANTVVAAVVGSIKKIAESKSADVKLNDVLFIEKMVVSYKNMIKSIIDALCIDDNGQAKDLHVLLGAMKDRNKSTSDKTVMKYKTIDAALQIPKVIDSMFDIVSKLGDSNVGFKTLVNFKINILRLKSMIKTVFNDLVTALSEIDTTKEMDRIIKCLVKQPDIITSVSEQFVDANSNKTSIEEKTTKNGKLGILDVFAKTFEIIGVLNTLKTPNFVLLKLRLLEMKIALTTTMNDLMKWCEKTINDDTRIRLMYVEDALLGSPTEGGKGKRVGGLQSIITALGNIISTANQINFKSVVSLIMFRSTLWILGGIINGVKRLYLLLKPLDTRWKTLDKSISNLLSIFESIAGIFKSITVVGLLAGPVIASTLLGSIAIFAICAFIGVIKLLEKTIIKAEINAQTILPLSDIFTSLKQIMIDVLLIGLIAVPAVVAMIAVSLFVGALLLTTIAIWTISKLIDGIAKNVNDNLKTLVATFGILMLIGVSILVLALAAPVIITALTENIGKLLLVLLISVITLAMVTWIASIISRKAVGYSLSLSINIILIMGALLAAAMVILVASVVGNMLKDSDAIGAIVLTIIGMIAISAVMIGLGIALSTASPFIGMATIGLTPVVILLGLMVAAGLAINKLAGFNFEFGKYEKGKTSAELGSGTGAMGNVGKILAFVKWMRDEIGNKNKNDIKGARKEKRFMRQVNKTVKRIIDIAKNLNKLSKLTLDKTAILGNVGAIFGFTTELDTYVNTFLLSNNTTPEITNSIETIKSVSNRQIKSARKKLNKVDNLIVTLSNVGNSLNSIQKLSINEDTIKTKIGYIFGVVDKLSELVNTHLNKEVIVEKSFLGIKYNKNVDSMNISNSDTKKMNRVDALMINIKNICTALESIKKFTLKDSELETIKGNISKMFTAISTIGAIVDEKSQEIKLDEDAVELNEKHINNCIRFIDSVNSIKVENVKATTQMFEKMAKFSSSIKGDFDKLAEALSDKMLPVLEDLKEVMSDVPEKLDKGFANTSASIAAANAPTTKENVIAQVRRENPNTDATNIDKLVEKRMADKAQQDAYSLSTKFDELISLLKGYTGDNVVVKTI